MAAQRLGRTLGFEHCEPRIALSTNAAGGNLSLSSALFASEGGLISFDASPMAQFNSDSVTTTVSGSVRSTVNGSTLLFTGDQSHVADMGVDRLFSVGSSSAADPKVRLIVPPTAGMQHPEGGQIAIIDRPGAGMAALASSELEVAQSKVSRQSPDSSAATTGGDSAAAREAVGLRGRAIVFEVAYTTTTASGKGDELAGPGSNVTTVEMSGAFASTQVALGQRSTTTGGAGHVERESSSRRASDADAQFAQHGKYAAATSQPMDEVPEYVVAKPTSSEANAISGAVGHEASLATLDAALEQWTYADAAPLTDSEPSPALAFVRSRKVLALALVLTVGASPISKLFRRRAPQEAPPQRPRHA